MWPSSWERGGEVVEEGLHRHSRNFGKDEGEAFTGGWVDGAEQVGPFVALLAQAARPLVTHPPAVAGTAFSADPAFILKPKLDALIGMRCGHRL